MENIYSDKINDNEICGEGIFDTILSIGKSLLPVAKVVLPAAIKGVEEYKNNKNKIAEQKVAEQIAYENRFNDEKKKQIMDLELDEKLNSLLLKKKQREGNGLIKQRH